MPFLTRKAFSGGCALIIAASGLLSPGLQAKEPASSGEGYTSGISVTLLQRTTTTASGQPITYPVTDAPEVTAVLVEIPPGADTGWHQHPYPCYAYMLSGKLTLEVKGGKPREIQAGDPLCEVVNTTHRGINNGTEPVRLVMFATGEAGKPFTVRVPTEAPGEGDAGGPDGP